MLAKSPEKPYMRLKLLYGAIACAIIVGGIVYRNYSKALSDAEVLERVNRAIAEEDAKLAASKERKLAVEPKVDPIIPSVVDPKVDEEQEKQFARDRQEAMEKLQAQADQLARQEKETAAKLQAKEEQKAKEEELNRTREAAKKKVNSKRAQIADVDPIEKKPPSPLESKFMKEMESSLLDNLLRIRKGFEETDDSTLKSELEKQAIEICEEFFESQRRLLKKPTNPKRSLAEDDLELSAINTREESMRSRMNKFLKGQLKSPL